MAKQGTNCPQDSTKRCSYLKKSTIIGVLEANILYHKLLTNDSL